MLSKCYRNHKQMVIWGKDCDARCNSLAVKIKIKERLGLNIFAQKT